MPAFSLSVQLTFEIAFLPKVTVCYRMDPGLVTRPSPARPGVSVEQKRNE